MTTRSEGEGRTALLNSVGLIRSHGNHELGRAVHKFIEGMPLDLQERRLLSDHCGENIAVLALMQDLRPDFVPALGLARPELQPREAWTDDTARRLRTAVEEALRFELVFDPSGYPEPVIVNALEEVLRHPDARITAFHFHQRWADADNGRQSNQGLLHRLRDALRGCASLQAVRGGVGVLWLLDRPVDHLAVTFEQPPGDDELRQLAQGLANGIGHFTCAAEDAAVFPLVARTIRTANEAAAAVQAVEVIYPFRAPRGREGVTATEALLCTPHLKTLTLPASEWLNLLDDDTLVGLIHRFGLQGLQLGDGLGVLSPAVKDALAANAARPANPPPV